MQEINKRVLNNILKTVGCFCEYRFVFRFGCLSPSRGWCDRCLADVTHSNAVVSRQRAVRKRGGRRDDVVCSPTAASDDAAAYPRVADVTSTRPAGCASPVTRGGRGRTRLTSPHPTSLAVVMSADVASSIAEDAARCPELVALVASPS